MFAHPYASNHPLSFTSLHHYIITDFSLAHKMDLYVFRKKRYIACASEIDVVRWWPELKGDNLDSSGDFRPEAKFVTL